MLCDQCSQCSSRGRQRSLKHVRNQPVTRDSGSTVDDQSAGTLSSEHDTKSKGQALEIVGLGEDLFVRIGTSDIVQRKLFAHDVVLAVSELALRISNVGMDFHQHSQGLFRVVALEHFDRQPAIVDSYETRT